MAKKKTPFDRMNEFLEEQNHNKQMKQVQQSDSTYDKPDLFTQMDELLQPKKPQRDYYAEAKEKRRFNDAKEKAILERPARSTPSVFETKPKAPQEREGVLGFLDRYVAPISKGATEFLAPGNAEQMAENERNKYGEVKNPIVNAIQKDRGLETDILNTVGAIAAVSAPYSQAYKGADLAFNKIPRLAKIANPYAQKAIKGAMAGGVAEAGLAGVADWISPEEINAKDYAQRIGLGVAGGAILDPAMYGVGRGLSQGLETTLKKLIPDQPLPEFTGSVRPEILDKIANTQRKLGIEPGSPIDIDPAFNVKRYHNPNQPLNEFLGKQAPDSPLLEMAKKTNYTERLLPDFSTAKPVVEGGDNVNVYGVETPSKYLVDSASPKYWQGRYEEFVSHVNSNYDTNTLTQESLEDLWSQFARYDEPVTLEQVVDLAYTGYKEPKILDANEVWNKLGNRPPASKNAKKIIGMDDMKQPRIQNTLVHEQFPVTRPTQNAEVQVNRTMLQEVPNVSQPISKQPENIPYVKGEAKHYSTLANSEKAPNEFVDGIKNLDRKISNSLSDKDAVGFANGIIKRDIEEAFQFVKNADVRDKRHVTVGARLIDEFNKSRQFERAVDMADILAKEGTKAGQKLQSFSLYDRLTVEGQLVRVQRRIIKLNESLPEGKKITLTSEITNDIVVAAESIQKLTGQQDIGNNVISLLEKAKKGNRLNDEELKVVHSFMSDAKKFVGDLNVSTKPPKLKTVKDLRTRDKVVEFMSRQELEAKKRIEARRNRINSLPVDVFYDYAIIGASKIAKGTVKFSDFSEQMIKELGEEVRPWMQQIYNKAVENFNITSEKITPKRLSQAEKLVNKAVADQTLSSDVADELIDLTKRLLNATGDMKFEASMELQVALNKLEQPTFAQMVSSAHIQSMLSGTLTMVRNIIGNEVFYRVDRASKLLAVPIDTVYSKVTGSKRTIVFNTGQFNWKTFFNPSKDYGKGWKIGAKAGYKGTNPLGINTAYDIKSPAFSSKYSDMNIKELFTTKDKTLNLPMRLLTSKYNPLHWTEKVLGVTLRSFDTAGYMRAYNQALREQATLRAMNEGLKGKALREAAEKYFREADENMIGIAEEYGKYATFQDNTPLSRALTKFKEGANQVSTYPIGSTKEFGLGSLIMPFPKTPANLIMRALEYSPAGIFRSVKLFYNYGRISKNPLELREGQIAFTRAIMGTVGFSGFGYILADKGVLTSAGDSDYDVKELERMAGKQPNSVNITAIQRFIYGGLNLNDLDLQEGDTFVSYDWMQPISLSVSLGTGINQAYRENENPTTGQKLVRAGDSAANTVINMSSLSGVNRLLSGPPNETWSEKLAGSLSTSGGSFVPTILNQFRKTNDNTARNTNDPTFNEKFINSAINRVPGKQNLLPLSFNTFGEKKELYPNGTNNLFNVFLNPSYVSQYKPSEEEKVLLDYIERTGDRTAAPPRAPKSIKVEGQDGKLSETVLLTGEEQSEYQRIIGEEIKKRLKSSLETLKRADDDRIEKLIDDIYREAGDKAREAIRAGRR